MSVATPAIPLSSQVGPAATGLRISYLLAPITGFYALFLILPYGYILWLSSTHYNSTLLFEPTFTLENYVSVLTDPYYLGLLAETVGLGLFVTFVCLLVGYPLAMKIVASRPHIKSLLLMLVMSPLLVNVVVRTYAWLVLLGDNGIVNKGLMNLGLITSPLPISSNFISVAIGLTHLSLPLMVLSLVSIMEKLDMTLIEAGRSLGAGSFRILRKLHFPLCWQGVGTGSLLVFCTVISAFVTPQLLGGNRFSTISTVIYQKFTFSMNWPVGATLVFILLALNFAVILLHGYVFRER